MPAHDQVDAGAGEDEDEEHDDDEECDDDAFDVAAADASIRGFYTDEAGVYAWFVSTFVPFFHARTGVEFWDLTAAFFAAEGRYDVFVKAIARRDVPVNMGDGAMVTALRNIFQTLRPIQRIVESCENGTAYMCLKHNDKF